MVDASTASCKGRVSERVERVPLSFFEAEAHPVEALKEIDVETLTPLEALTRLPEL
ncbi:MAG: hypothetical protein KY468_21085 [Armatimonadetes bacterium]|nr:hypothetical protein [Armatimonadota bacterium]